MVETVGVGQDEIDIAQMAHTTVLVAVPGMGDDIQAIKAGILEVADVFVVNKADLDGADRTVRELRQMLELRHALRAPATGPRPRAPPEGARRGEARRAAAGEQRVGAAHPQDRRRAGRGGRPADGRRRPAPRVPRADRAARRARARPGPDAVPRAAAQTGSSSRRSSDSRPRRAGWTRWRLAIAAARPTRTRSRRPRPAARHLKPMPAPSRPPDAVLARRPEAAGWASTCWTRCTGWPRSPTRATSTSTGTRARRQRAARVPRRRGGRPRRQPPADGALPRGRRGRALQAPRAARQRGQPRPGGAPARASGDLLRWAAARS